MGVGASGRGVVSEVVVVLLGVFVLEWGGGMPNMSTHFTNSVRKG